MASGEPARPRESARMSTLGDPNAATSSRIRILDDATISQIAAGEVIERPASVVKELVENSLDAGATRVAVDLADGGRSLIVVRDDGEGIARDELRLALARHATSKLAKPHDLFAVRTLGFRGEGLASIAAAGRVEVTSRPSDAQLGARIAAQGTWIGEPSAVAAPPGTTVSVSELFAKTPVRRQFLKSARAEFMRASDFLSRLSLGWPHVAFELRHDGQAAWSLPAVRDPIDRLELVFGKSSRGELIAILEDFAGAAVRVAGFINRPGRDRPNRNHQTFVVNRRLVRSPALGAAWLAGYASFGMTGRYPYGLVSVEVPPDEVDVNVHPTKIEVRFASPPAVFEAVKTAITRTLRRSPVVSALRDAAGRETADFRDGATVQPETLRLDATFVEAAAEPDVRVYGQVDRTYIVAGDASGVVVVDQHAAHERIAYEALLDRSGAGEIRAAPLLPAIVELTPAHAALLQDLEAELAGAGIIVERYDGSAYRIVELPAGYERRRFDLIGILDDLAADDAPREGTAHRNRLLATIACHSVVRAHEPLALQEQVALLERLRRCRDPHTCPHGRPTMVRLDARALAKAFSRL